MGDLEQDTSLSGGEGSWKATLSRDWTVWAGMPTGGYIAALCLRAAGADTSLTLPASLACHFLGVASFGEVDITTRKLRSSTRAESIVVDMSQESRPIAHAIVWVVAEGLDGLEHDKADPLPAKPFDNYANREEIFGSAAAATYPMHMNWEERPIESFADGAWFTRQAGKPEMGIWFKYLP